MNRKLLLPLALTAIAVASTPSWSANSVAPSAATQQHGWLGVYIRPMPRALAAQLKDLMPSGEGILVEQVAKNSPAEKAGIQNNDILLAFGEQKLYSPAQLSRLVASTPAQSKVKITLIRQGKSKTLEATIGQQEPQAQANPHHRRHHFAQVQPLPRPNLQAPQAPLVWDSFESVQVKTLPNGRYHAEVSFKNRNNETKSFTFEGKKEEIIRQIQQQKDLPDNKKQALLNALNMNQPPFMPSFNKPFFQGNPFNDPFFRNDPFFNAPFPGFQQRPFFRPYPPQAQPAPQQQPPRW